MDLRTKTCFCVAIAAGQRMLEVPSRPSTYSAYLIWGLGGRNGRARALVRNAFAILDASVVGIRGGVLVLALALELDGLGI